MGVARLLIAAAAWLALDPRTMVMPLRARGAAAADLRAPSAAVARTRAERTARMRAEKSLEALLETLKPNGSKLPPKRVKELVAAAKVVDEQFGSDGSVELTLELPRAELTLHSNSKSVPKK
jgi:hypothetical protein